MLFVRLLGIISLAVAFKPQHRRTATHSCGDSLSMSSTSSPSTPGTTAATTSATERYVSVGATVLRCESLSKSFTGTPQFDGISFTIGKGQRIGLIGVNGAGKSTLLKCLAKIESPDSGEVDTAKFCNVIYVDQEPNWKNLKVFEALYSGNSDQAKATRAYFAALDPTLPGDASGDQLAKATDDVEAAQAWDFQSLGMYIAERLNIPSEMYYRDTSTLSGGERKRVGLAAALLKQPDILLLDEVLPFIFIYCFPRTPLNLK